MTIQQKRYFVWLVNHHLYFLARFLRSRFAWWPRSSLDLCWPYSAARQLLEPFMEICMLSTMLVVCQSWIQHWISNASIMSRNPIPKSMLWHAWPTIPRLTVASGFSPNAPPDCAACVLCIDMRWQRCLSRGAAQLQIPMPLSLC